MDTKNDTIHWEHSQNQEDSGNIAKIVGGTLFLLPAPFFASVPLAALQDSTVANMVSNGLCGIMENINIPTILSDTCYSLTTLLPNDNSQSRIVGGIFLTVVCLAIGVSFISVGIRGIINYKSRTQ